MAAIATNPGRASLTAPTTAKAGRLSLARKFTPGRHETTTSTAPAAWAWHGGRARRRRRAGARAW
eukprot:14603955-Alexandrium_andersonii.AAC.1